MPHAPAPWTADSSSRNGQQFLDANGKLILIADGHDIVVEPDDRDLILAAPELLAACQKALAVFDGIHTRPGLAHWYVDECVEAVEKLKAAIEKATPRPS